MNRICNICRIEIHEKSYLKDRTVCKSCYNKNRRKNNKNTSKQNQQPEIDKINNNNDNNPNVSTYENQAYVVIGPRNVGKTYYMLRMLEKQVTKDQFIQKLDPPIKIRIKKQVMKLGKKKYKGSVVVFDDMLGARNSSQLDEFFTRGRHEDLDVFYLNQSYFSLPR